MNTQDFILTLEDTEFVGVSFMQAYRKAEVEVHCKSNDQDSYQRWSFVVWETEHMVVFAEPHLSSAAGKIVEYDDVVEQILSSAIHIVTRLTLKSDLPFVLAWPSCKGSWAYREESHRLHKKHKGVTIHGYIWHHVTWGRAKENPELELPGGGSYEGFLSWLGEWDARHSRIGLDYSERSE